jgi:hypothetical protein
MRDGPSDRISPWNVWTNRWLDLEIVGHRIIIRIEDKKRRALTVKYLLTCEPSVTIRYRRKFLRDVTVS